MAEMKLPEAIGGWCDTRFSAVAELLAAQLASGAHHGAAIAVRHRGDPVVDIWGGAGWSESTIAVSFSTTKGPASTALHMAMERAGIEYDAPVASVWPEFGKKAVTIRHVLCHEAPWSLTWLNLHRTPLAGVGISLDMLRAHWLPTLTHLSVNESTRSYFSDVIAAGKWRGCDAVVLGCTEFPLLISAADSPLPVLASTRILARAALREAIH